MGLIRTGLRSSRAEVESEPRLSYILPGTGDKSPVGAFISAQNVRYQKWNIDPGVCGHPGTWLAESLALFSKPLSCRSHNRKLPATLAPHVSAGSHADKTVNNEPKSQASVQCQSSLARLRVSLWLPKGVGTFGRQSKTPSDFGSTRFRW